MKEIQRIAEQLKCSFYKGAWHGPSLMESLNSVTAKQALKHTIPKAHSIWELVLHSETWIRVVNKTIADMQFTQIPDEINFPKIKNKSEESWKRTIASLEKAHKKLEKHVSLLKDAALDKIPANTSSTVYRLLHGVIQHNIYHAGQISILKKEK